MVVLLGLSCISTLALGWDSVFLVLVSQFKFLGVHLSLRLLTFDVALLSLLTVSLLFPSMEKSTIAREGPREFFLLRLPPAFTPCALTHAHVHPVDGLHMSQGWLQPVNYSL